MWLEPLAAVLDVAVPECSSQGVTFLTSRCSAVVRAWVASASALVSRRRMVRALAQQLRPLLVQQLNSFANGQAFAQYAVPAVAVPQSGGLFGSKRVTTPLSEPLPGVSLPNSVAPKAPELKVGGATGLLLLLGRAAVGVFEVRGGGFKAGCEMLQQA